MLLITITIIIIIIIIVATSSTHFPSVHVVCISKTTPFAWQSVFA